MNPPLVSVVICTHNPNRELLGRVIVSLEQQSADKSEWELILVDNASKDPLEKAEFAIPEGTLRIFREDRLGLTHARLAGFKDARANLVLYVDDDNILNPTYIERAIEFMEAHPKVGIAGGKVIAKSAGRLPEYFEDFSMMLACRDLGEKELIGGWQGSGGRKAYPEFAPIGAGMVVRKEVLQIYADRLAGISEKLVGDREGESLSSGGDNDLVMTALDNDWKVAYVPSLELDHHLPDHRLTPEYLARLNRESSRSWVKVLDVHGLRPWTPVPRVAVPLLKVKYYLKWRAWTNAKRYIRWCGFCGLAEGRADLK